MKIKHFSEKVLEAKARRKHSRIRHVILAGILILQAANVWYIHARYVRVTAPTWADFASTYTSKPLYETIVGTHSDDVPSQLIIDGKRWSVVLVDHFNDNNKRGKTAVTMAQTYCSTLTIAYIASTDERILHENLWHEVFHAGACAHGGDQWWNSAETSHKGVYNLGEFMVTFAHDNPVFMRWQQRW